MVSHSKWVSITGLLIRAALEVTLLEAGIGPDQRKPVTARVLDAITRAWMVEVMKYMADSGIDLSHDVCVSQPIVYTMSDWYCKLS
jgi:hypothetical protein